MKILIIDDHPLFAEGLKYLIESASPEISVSISFNVETALTIDDDDYDLILVDYVLQTYDGLDLMKYFSSKKILTPTVLMSATEDVSVMLKAKELGASGFISKTCQTFEMLRAIKSIIETGECWPDDIMRKVNRLNTSQIRRSDTNYNKMTGRQIEIVELIAKGYSTKKIAQILDLSPNTVKTHISNIFALLNVNNRLACISKAKSFCKNREVI